LEIGPSFGVVMHPDLGEVWKVGSVKVLGVCVPSLNVDYVEKKSSLKGLWRLDVALEPTFEGFGP
jgi:hypothetical protein